MEIRSWKYQRCWTKIPLSVKNTTTILTSRKQTNRATQLELSRTLENNSFVSQEYYNPFHFKEAKESNNAAGIVKNAEEHFLCQPTILQSLQLQGSKRMKQHSWNYQERWTTFPLAFKSYTTASRSSKKNRIAKEVGYFLCGSRFLHCPSLSNGSKWSRLEHWTTYSHCWSRILQIVFKFNEKSRRLESNWTYLDMQHFAVSQKNSVVSLRSTKPDQEWNKKKCSMYRYLSPTTNLPFCDL